MRGDVVERDMGPLARIGREEGAARQLQEVAIAGLVLHQQHQGVRVRLPPVADPAIAVAVLAPDAQLAADDRLHAGLGRGRGEFERAEQIAGVGDGDRRHGLGAAQRHDLVDLERALGQRIGGVDAEMDEIGVRHSGFPIGRRMSALINSTKPRASHERPNDLPRPPVLSTESVDNRID